MVVFYVLVPIPTQLAKRHVNSGGDSTSCQEFALFLTVAMVISSFAFPFVLNHASVVSIYSSILPFVGYDGI